MTDDARPDEPNGQQVLAQFLQDWTRLWRDELQAQGSDPGGFAGKSGGGSTPDMSAAMDLWRSAMGAWSETLGASPGRSRDRSTPPRSAASAVAPDSRDAEIERLARRIDELEARLAKLEAPRRRRG